MNTTKSTPFNRPKVPCRAVFVVQSRNKGVPIGSCAGHGAGSLPSEEALMGCGLVGMADHGHMFGRIGIYNFNDGVPTFKYAVTLDMSDGRPAASAEDGRSRPQPSQAESALLNWIQGPSESLLP